MACGKVADRMPLAYHSLTAALMPALEPWFDDSETQRYLGGRPWLHRALALVRSQPGTPSGATTVAGRYVWVAAPAPERYVGLVDLETYADNSASFAFVVAPQLRGQGWGRQLLAELLARPELAQITLLYSDVDAVNTASRRCLERAGFTVGATADADGLLPVTLERQIP